MRTPTPVGQRLSVTSSHDEGKAITRRGEHPQGLNDYMTTKTLQSIPIYAALHLRGPRRVERYVSISIGDSTATFDAEVARQLAGMMLKAADILEHPGR